MPEKDLNLASKLRPDERYAKELALKNICPDDAKYSDTTHKLDHLLSADAEWRACAYVQKILIETRSIYSESKVHRRHVEEVENSLRRIIPLNMSLIEKQITRHDQLAVLEEIGRFVSKDTKAFLHPGTTSYDILDTARSYLFKKAWFEVIRPEVAKGIEQLCRLANRFIVESDDYLQVGRTHLKNTSPVPFGVTLAGYAARMAKKMNECDEHINDLRGKFSGMVGTGAGIEMVIGKGKAMDFEKRALKKLGLEPDYTATQIVQKEGLVIAGESLVLLMKVLGEFANDIRLMYSSAIGEVFSMSNQERLGGSSADAIKDNPINWENICGTVPIVEAGMHILHYLVSSDFQRDLRGSKPARYQPQMMMAEIYESFVRLNEKCLPDLTANQELMARNLVDVRNNPSEAMVAILKGEGWIHSEYGIGHDFVKEMGKRAKASGRKLLDVCREDDEFMHVYTGLSDEKTEILNGEMEKYIGDSLERAKINVTYSRDIIKKEVWRDPAMEEKVE